MVHSTATVGYGLISQPTTIDTIPVRASQQATSYKKSHADSRAATPVAPAQARLAMTCLTWL